ncbi:MAG TPA: hypothetical protein VMZ92_08450 [Planctomycetota bacterium]|nr:hypothetical protein [Planctomycetota bacterium]
MPVLLIIAVIILVAVGIYLGWLWEKKRREALAKMAAALELNFSAGDPFHLPGRLGHIHTFSRGHSQRAKNVVHGTYRGRDMIAFDFKYTTTHTSTDSKGRTTTHNVDHHFSACVHPLECRFPRLAIRPEGFFDKVADFFGFDDIDFESDEFSRKFRVTSDNRKFAYDVCHVRTMEWLLATRGWHMEMVGGYWVLTTDRRWSAEEFHSGLSFTWKFFEMIPDFVWREYSERATT